MQKRSLAALILAGYSVLLVTVVVFKDAIGVAAWTREGRDERIYAERPGRVRGDRRPVDGSEGPAPGRMGRGPAALREARRSTSRFAPLHANYVPFKTILPQLRGQPRWTSAILNLVGNTLLFVPVGFLVLRVCRQMRWRHALVLAVAVGVAMEVMEGLLRVGVVDVDDVILNALGVLSGYWLGRAGARAPSEQGDVVRGDTRRG